MSDPGAAEDDRPRRPACRCTFGAFVRAIGATAAGCTAGLLIDALWPQPANPALINAVSFDVIWIGVLTGNLWARLYLARAGHK